MKNNSINFKQILTISFISISLIFTNCEPKLYKIYKDENGEPILNENSKYTFNYILTDFDSKKIDTTANYIQIFQNKYELSDPNPMIIKFHNDGYFKTQSLKYYGKFDAKRKKNSVYYGGKYKISGNIIETERFLPGSPITRNTFHKSIKIGEIMGDTIKFKYKNYSDIYVKQK